MERRRASDLQDKTQDLDNTKLLNNHISLYTIMEKNNKLLIRIKSFINQKQVYFTDHAWIAMDDRKIKSNDVINVIINGEIIENYSDSKPCPSCLILGYKKGQAIHVVIALCKNHIRIVTTYEPNKNEWVNDRIRRRKKSD